MASAVARGAMGPPCHSQWYVIRPRYDARALPRGKSAWTRPEDVLGQAIGVRTTAPKFAGPAAATLQGHEVVTRPCAPVVLRIPYHGARFSIDAY
jgi:hypothetical protein